MRCQQVSARKSTSDCANRIYQISLADWMILRHLLQNRLRTFETLWRRRRRHRRTVKSKIPKFLSQFGHRTIAAVPRLVITSQELSQNKKHVSHCRSLKWKEVDGAPEPIANRLEQSQFGVSYQLYSLSTSHLSTSKSPPRSPDRFSPISSVGPSQTMPSQTLSHQTSASSLQERVPRTPALHHTLSISALHIPPQFRSTLSSRILTTSNSITDLNSGVRGAESHGPPYRGQLEKSSNGEPRNPWRFNLLAPFSQQSNHRTRSPIS